MSPPLGRASGELHAGIEIGGTHVGVLIEGAADGQQQAVQGGVIGDFGMSDGAEQDGVAGLQQIDGAGRHHAAPAEEVVRAPVEILKREGDVVLLRALFEDAFCLRDDFGADTVAGDHRNREGFIGSNTIVAGSISAD